MNAIHLIFILHILKPIFFYEKSLINHLFSFDLEKKTILIKDKNRFNYNASSNDFSKGNNIVSSTKLIQNKNKLSNPKRIINEDMIINSNSNNISIYKNSRLSTKRELKKKHSPKKHFKKEKAKKIPKIKMEEECCNNNNKAFYRNNTNEFKKDINYEREKKENTLPPKIDKIKINKFYIYFCFCCLRKKDNIRNALIDEGMKIIIERLDIMNIFNRLYKDEKIQEKINVEDIEMSDECKQKIEKNYQNV